MLIFYLHISIFLLVGLFYCNFVIPLPQVLIRQVGELHISFLVFPPMTHLSWRYFAYSKKNLCFSFFIFFFCGWCLKLMVDVWWVVYGVDMFFGTCGPVVCGVDILLGTGGLVVCGMK